MTRTCKVKNTCVLLCWCLHVYDQRAASASLMKVSVYVLRQMTEWQVHGRGMATRTRTPQIDAQILLHLYLKTLSFNPALLPFNPYPVCVWNRDFFFNSQPIWIPQLLMMTRLLCASENWKLCPHRHSLQPDTIFNQITDLYFLSSKEQ